MTVKLVTDSALEPVAVEDFRDYARIAHAIEDVRLEQFIKAARLWCEDVTGRQFINASWKLVLEWFPAEIELFKLPVSAITHVKYYDVDNAIQTLVTGTDYEEGKDSEPARIRPAYGTTWPNTYTRYDAVEVQWVAGYGAAVANVPENYQQAVRILAAHWYENRGTVVIGKVAGDIKLTVEALLMADRVWQFK